MCKNFICSIDRMPAEGDKGYSSIAFHRIKFLVESGYSVTVISFFNKNNPSDLKAKLKLESLGVSLELIRVNRIEKILNVLKFPFFSIDPIQCLLVKSKDFKLRAELVLKKNPDSFFYFVLSRTSVNVDLSPNVKYIVDFVDSMALNFDRRAKKANFFMKAIYKIESYRINFFEQNLANKSFCSFVVSGIDKVFFNSNKVHVNKLGTDLSSFYPENLDKTNDLIFTGNMNYKPNSEAVIWFIENCFEEVLRNNKKISLVIAGRNPSSKLLAYNRIYNKNIKVLGYVESMRDVINRSRLALAPMQSGSGMQNKILEAFACGIPVVTTSIGLGDISAKNQKDILVADDPVAFTSNILEILNNPNKALKYGGNGLKYVNKNHNFISINEDFLTKIKSTET